MFGTPSNSTNHHNIAHRDLFPKTTANICSITELQKNYTIGLFIREGREIPVQ